MKDMQNEVKECGWHVAEASTLRWGMWEVNLINQWETFLSNMSEMKVGEKVSMCKKRNDLKNSGVCR